MGEQRSKAVMAVMAVLGGGRTVTEVARDWEVVAADAGANGGWVRLIDRRRAAGRHRGISRGGRTDVGLAAELQAGSRSPIPIA